MCAQGLAQLPEWTAAGGGTSGVGVALPSFSAYPLPYVTQIGEWLMALPQVRGNTQGGARRRGRGGLQRLLPWLCRCVAARVRGGTWGAAAAPHNGGRLLSCAPPRPATWCRTMLPSSRHPRAGLGGADQRG